MKKNRLLRRISLLLLVVCLLFSGCSGLFAPKTLTVAIYPYVPDMELFRQVLTRQWEELEPNVELDWVYWDCYSHPDPEKIDVMTYDALFTSYLAENNYIQPISEDQLQDKESILPFAVEGAYHEQELYGVPFLVCSYFLIHRSQDTELAAVQSMNQLYDVLQDRKQLDAADGLLTNYGGDYPYHYLEALVDLSGTYSVFADAPSTNPRDPEAYELLCRMQASLAPTPEVTGYEDLGIYQGSALFNDGMGSAYYGYSESMSFMEDILDDITIRTISFSDTDNVQLFFADIASMGAHVKNPRKQELCIKLMNLIGSEEFQEELCFGTGDAQYMLPARQDVYLRAQETYPMYARLYELAMDDSNHIFRFGKDIHEFLSTAYGDLE